jgi:hypothetical protein
MVSITRRRLVQAPVAASLGAIIARFPGSRLIRAQGAAYDLVDLGQFRVITRADGSAAFLESARAVNDEGTVAGNLAISEERIAPVTWSSGGEMSRLRSGKYGGVAYGLNNTGLVVGSLFRGFASQEQPVYWRDGERASLPAPDELGSEFVGLARAVNDAGVIAGWVATPPPEGVAPAQIPVRWIGNEVEALPVPEGTTSARAEVVDQAGVVIGAAQIGIAGGQSAGRAVIWSDDGMTLLDLPEGHAEADTSGAAGIDAAGRVYVTVLAAGFSSSTSYVYESGVPTPLPPLNASDRYSQVTGVNRSNVAVGSGFDDPGGAIRAVIWTDGEPAPLSELIPADSGLTLGHPGAISDTGYIVAAATAGSGEQHRVLLVPAE